MTYYNEEMNEEQKTCSHCGAKMVAYKHKLNYGMAQSLKKLYALGGSAHLNALELNYNQRCNFQKIRYWGLVFKSNQESGVWVISSYGKMFVEGKVSAPSHAWSYRGEPIEKEDSEITHIYFSDLTPVNNAKIDKELAVYKKREDYADDSEPHG